MPFHLRSLFSASHRILSCLYNNITASRFATPLRGEIVQNRGEKGVKIMGNAKKTALNVNTYIQNGRF